MVVDDADGAALADSCSCLGLRHLNLLPLQLFLVLFELVPNLQLGLDA